MVSLNDYGVIILWLFGNMIFIFYEVKLFEFLEVNIGFKFFVLILLLILERRDFLFIKGLFLDFRDLLSEVTVVVFYFLVIFLGR